MRQKKYDQLLNVSIAILIISSIMLGITFYKLFFNTNNASFAAVTNTLPSKLYNIKRDSLRNIYTQTVHDFENKFKPTATNNVDDKTAIELNKIAALKSEIGNLLNNYSSEADLVLANEKIATLQKQVDLLTNNYSAVSSENKRLQLLLQQLLATKNSEVKNSNTAVTTSPQSNNVHFNNVHLFAINKNNTPVSNVTNDPVQWVGTFSVNNLPLSNAAEVCLVLLQPNGEVVKNAAWDAGVFETQEGKKVYSKKIALTDITADKQINFAINMDSFFKGTYVLQIWHNGKLVAKTTQSLV